MTPPEIKILPDDVANKIAAGEVVERPASVVKELLENSIDAGATRIDVEFKHGGKTFIKVLDNGCGMTREQALMSLEIHATSKIRKADDIFDVSSYGFRGEAVPSIASVSKFRMRTRPEMSPFGVQIDAYASEVLSVKECGMPSGTEILVENIFAGIPARRKFLKSDNVEAGHIIRLCRLYALALPNLSITTIENSKVLFRSEGGLGIIQRVAKIFGRDLASNLMELKPYERNGMRISGAILSPNGESFATAKNICTFINNRPVDSRTVYTAVREAYSQFIPKGRFAAAFLFLELNPASVDVNVHPAKREVRLKDEYFVKNFIYDAIANRLSSFSFANNFDETLQGKSNKVAFETPTKNIFEPKISTIYKSDSINVPKESLRSEYRPISVSEPSAVLEPPPEIKITPAISPAISGVFVGKQSVEITPRNSNPLRDWRYIGCLANRYALFETPKSLAMMSILHALRRIGYSRIINALSEKNAKSQTLLIPISLKLENIEDDFFVANKTAFESCGFGVEDFGSNCYRITAIPAWLDVSAAEVFLKDVIESSVEQGGITCRRKLGDDAFARAMSAKITARDFACSEISAYELLKDLLSCEMYMTSPDGYLTLKEYSFAELAKK